jgi:hypothetical protein
MSYIIIGAILAIAITTGVIIAIRRIDRAGQRRYAEALARLAALPLNQRLDELLKARAERARARIHLADVRRAFNGSWGYRHNPHFSPLLIAQAAYSAAREWVRNVEELCNEPNDQGE